MTPASRCAATCAVRRLTFGLGGLLDRVELPADVLQPLLQLLALLQGQLLLRLADAVLLGCRRRETEKGEFKLRCTCTGRPGQLGSDQG